MKSFIASRGHARKSILITTMLLLLFLPLLSACNGSSQAQQRALVQKAQLDRLLAQARNIGVPVSMFQSIIRQEQQISRAKVPLALFSDQPVTDYYSNVARRYQILAAEVSGLEVRVTQQDEYQASLDLQSFENVLTERQSQNLIEAKAFADQFAQEESLFEKAQYPREYLQISNSARRSTQALHLMGSVYSKLQALHQVIQQLQTFHMDTTALTQEEQAALTLFRAAKTPEDFSSLIDLLGVQLQEETVLAIQAIPYFGTYEGTIKLQTLSATIDEGRKYGLDVKPFQERLYTDQAALETARVGEYASILSQIDRDIAEMQVPLAHAEANYFLNQFNHEVHVWGKYHQYLDPSNGQAYPLDYEYDTQGIGSDLATAVQSSQTVDDYQAAIMLINTALLHLKAMEADYGDSRPWYRAHVADLGLLKYYHLDGADSGSVIVVSLVEQVLRLYQGGKHIMSFQVTTGQYARPSPPGLWSVFLRQHPTEFKSTEPPGSAFWYPPTPIQYAMEYHGGGYFLHDSWWRADYGVGTNFPHYDSGGDETFAGNGSHGCINMAPNDVAWLYAHTGYGTTVILY